MVLLFSISNSLIAQPYGNPDRGQPGDAMIHAWLSQKAAQLHETYLEDTDTKEDWLTQKPRLTEEYLYMLGLSPMPEKTPLQATITGTLKGEGYEVDMIHYQSSPGLYVTGNLYRPASVRPGEKLPTILYVSGHAQRGRNGNKTAYQSHGIWFARHGYLCLMLDTLQRGEVKGIHHGTYRYERWWWHSRGYTPAGVETWNGIRGIDYLLGRPDVDPDRIGVTGISGGGAVSFWITAADDRVKVTVPVSGMADLPSYLEDYVINGHCDCMFFYNTYQWPWARIAAMIAPRPQLFANSDADPIFPMNANERVSNRLETFYSLFGAGDQIETLVSIGGHAYREDIRKASFRFMNIHLKNDPSPVLDSEIDLVTGNRGEEAHPIPPEALRVFPGNEDLPQDALNGVIDEHFVPTARIEPPKQGGFESWKQTLIEDLRAASFRSFPERIPAAQLQASEAHGTMTLETEPGISVSLTRLQTVDRPQTVVLFVNGDLLNASHSDDSDVYQLDPRGIGPTAWSSRNPPNYVERAHLLIGRTVADGRIWDIVSTAKYLKSRYDNEVPLIVAGDGASAVLAAYATLLEPAIDGARLAAAPKSHMEDSCPPLLNVLRVCDVPEILGALAPKPLQLIRFDPSAKETVKAIYKTADALDQLSVAE